MRAILYLAALTVLMSACAGFSPQAQTSPALLQGGILVDAAGMSLYTFEKDPAGGGKSVCNGPCAANWPPLAASAKDAGRGDFSVINRDDGAKQWAYKGKPLYRWIKDQKPGDKTGDGFNKVWHLAS